MMNGAQFHLLVNHAAVVGIPLGLAAYAAARWLESEAAERIALGLLAVSALMALPAYFSGEDAERVLKAFPGGAPAKGVIHAHEEMAEKALAAAVALGAAALAVLGLRFKTGKTPSWSMPAVGLTGLAAAVLLAWTCHLGGLVRHPEVSAPAPAASEADAD